MRLLPYNHSQEVTVQHKASGEKIAGIVIGRNSSLDDVFDFVKRKDPKAGIKYMNEREKHYLHFCENVHLKHECLCRGTSRGLVRWGHSLYLVAETDRAYNTLHKAASDMSLLHTNPLAYVFIADKDDSSFLKDFKII